MTTCHGGAGHAHKDIDLNLHVEDARNIDMGPENDNEGSLDTTIAFGGSEEMDALVTSCMMARQTWTYSQWK